MWSRRQFIGQGAVVAVSAALGRRFWRPEPSLAAVSAEPPYGPLLPPDANGIRVPAGFRARVIGRTAQPVGGTGYVWHTLPDGGATVPASDGGWFYVSNSEAELAGGGVSAVRFDPSGEIVDAYSILTGTTRNCAGGATSRGTWLSCEEHDAGQVYECEPSTAGQGVVRPRLGTFRHEAAAEDPVTGIVYLSEDHPEGRLYRFVPDVPGDLDAGRLEAAAVSGSSLSWHEVADDAPDRSARTTGFDGGEGLAVDGRTLYFSTKGDRRIRMHDLDSGHLRVLFDAEATPSVLTEVDNLTVHHPSGDLFVAEDGGDMQLVQVVRAADGVVTHPVVQFVGHDSSEVTGPAFDPSGSRLYLSSQRGVDGIHGWTIEVSGPFRVTRAAGAASVSGVVRPDRLDAIEIGRQGR